MSCPKCGKPEPPFGESGFYICEQATPTRQAAEALYSLIRQNDAVTSIDLIEAAFKAQRREEVEAIIEYWKAPNWSELAKQFPADDHPKWSDSFVGWLAQRKKELE